MKRIASVVLVTTFALGTTVAEAKPTERAARGQATAIEGLWVNDIPCLPYTGQPGPGLPPASAEFSCAGTSVYTGDWTGHTSYTATGTVDVERREAVATAEQWFVGTYTGDGSVGAIHFRSVVHLDLTTGAFHDSSLILDGTCAFEGSKGWVEFEGLSAAGALGGTYVGSWKRKATDSDPLCDPGAPLLPRPD
jgi:hypothetical protein